MKYFLPMLICSGILFAQQANERTFLLKNGDKVTGTFVAENDSAIVLQTSFGEISVLKKNIKPQKITLYLKDGSVVSGDVMEKNETNFVLSTAFGVVTIENNKIDRTTDPGGFIPGTVKKEEFYYSDERLIDIFFDPTGYTMEKGSLYFSGLSWGVALTENIDISSAYWRYFFADLNIRPKVQLYKSGSLEAEQAFAIGFHLHSGGPTGKFRFVKNQYPRYDWMGNFSGYDFNNEWSSVGNDNDYFFWTEVFAAYTYSVLKGDKQGRVAYHFGVSNIFHRAETMPRAWLAVENDITRRFKIIGQIYYDPFQPSYRERTQNVKTNNPLDVDFGFVYAYEENFRVGIHYQPYIILFYFKF